MSYAIIITFFTNLILGSKNVLKPTIILIIHFFLFRPVIKMPLSKYNVNTFINRLT